MTDPPRLKSRGCFNKHDGPSKTQIPRLLSVSMTCGPPCSAYFADVHHKHRGTRERESIHRGLWRDRCERKGRDWTRDGEGKSEESELEIFIFCVCVELCVSTVWVWMWMCVWCGVWACVCQCVLRFIRHVGAFSFQNTRRLHEEFIVSILMEVHLPSILNTEWTE